jgi:hypothetical protein
VGTLFKILKWLSNGGLDKLEEILALISALIDKIADFFNRLTNGSTSAKRATLEEELKKNEQG